MFYYLLGNAVKLKYPSSYSGIELSKENLRSLLIVTSSLSISILVFIISFSVPIIPKFKLDASIIFGLNKGKLFSEPELIKDWGKINY